MNFALLFEQPNIFQQALQSEIDSLQKKIEIFEKSQLDEQGAQQGVYNSINQMLERVAEDTDALPFNLPMPDLSNPSSISKAMEIIERLQREKNEEANRRLQLIAEQQSASTKLPEEETVPMREFNAVVTKLRTQIEVRFFL
jgi:hypothetical protein